MTNAVIVQAETGSQVGFECYGAARDFWSSKDREIVLSGPYETGKTITALHKLNALLCKYPNSKALIVRRTYDALLKSAIFTLEYKVWAYPSGNPKNPIVKYGKERPRYYTYPNGSKLILGGMNNPDDFLSAEYDFIYINQLEEITLRDYEVLQARATGRAGNAPYTQIMGDCNPSSPFHWILHRPSLKIFHSKHRDNPVLYDQSTGQLTRQGERTMQALMSLTGVRYKRGYLGLWVGTEGQVYEDFDPDVHVIKRFDIPEGWRRIRSIDFGYTNPACVQWWAISPDGVMYLYRELYCTKLLVEDLAGRIHELTKEPISRTISDHDAEDRATLERYGIFTTGARKDLKGGIEAVQQRLRTDPATGKPRIFFFEDALVEPDKSLLEAFKPVSTIEEFTSYCWHEDRQGGPIKEEPVDAYNHGMDAMRYAVLYEDRPKMKITRNPFYR